MAAVSTIALVAEYEATIDHVGPDAADDEIVAEFVSGHAWTERGARAIVMLARTYGTAILRNALALAAAMRIEDGESGL